VAGEKKINAADFYEGVADPPKRRAPRARRIKIGAMPDIQYRPRDPKAQRAVDRFESFKEPKNGVMSIAEGVLIAMEPGKRYRSHQVAERMGWADPDWVRGTLSALRKKGWLDAKRVPGKAARLWHVMHQPTARRTAFAYGLTARGLAARARAEERVRGRVEALGRRKALDALYSGKVRRFLED
jgi:hypothetical protein